MLPAIKTWLTGLSLMGRVGLVGAVAATGLVASPVVTGCHQPPVTRESIELVAIEAGADYKKDGSVAVGETRVISEGAKGEKNVKYSVVSECEKEKSRSVISEEQVKAPIASVVGKGTKREVSEDVPVPFSRVNENNPSLPRGTTQLKTSGINGTKRVTYEISENEGEPEVKRVLYEAMMVSPVAEVTYVGTKVQASCDSNYSGGCVPIVGYDLDCPDIGFSVYVVGYDKHRFDGDGDGAGCESY